MRALAATASLGLALLGCDPEPPRAGLTGLAAAYLGTGVVTVDREGAFLPSLRPFRFRFDVASAGALELAGAIGPRGSSPRTPIEGTFDRAAGRILVRAFEAPLTAPRAEQVVRFEARADDGAPDDGIASDLTGSVDTATRSETTRGRWVAIEVGPDPLPPPDLQRIRLARSERPGRLLLEGEPGASVGGAGLQILRFSPELEVPQVTTIPVGFSGAFLVDVPAEVADVLLLRAQASGRSGDASVLTVPEL